MLVALISVLMTMPSAGDAVPPPVGTARTAEPLYSLASLFAEADYPAEAFAKGVQGTTQVSLQVSDVGRVEKCNIEHSSGSAALDRATCQVITRRSRFRPAVDFAGRPVASNYAGSIEWTLR
ncbi:MAG: energy transducer TonB [Sphingomicrobium sp.]